MKAYNIITVMIIISSVFLAQMISSYVVDMMENFLLHTACTVSIGFFLTCIGLGGFNKYLEKLEDKNNN